MGTVIVWIPKPRCYKSSRAKISNWVGLLSASQFNLAIVNLEAGILLSASQFNLAIVNLETGILLSAGQFNLAIVNLETGILENRQKFRLKDMM